MVLILLYNYIIKNYTIIFHLSILDFAVGAPYDGDKERGAVYIYHGSKDGISALYTRDKTAVEKAAADIIYAEDIDPATRTFGWSLNGNMDLDFNQYPDIVIGAYHSDRVVYIR